MEKTLEIDGKQVRFKSTAATPLRYKAQFGRDFFADLLKMEKLRKFDPKKENYEILESLDTTVFLNIAWVLAKTADPKIPDPLTWFDTFESFPLDEVFSDLQDLLIHSLQSKKK